MNRRGFLAKVTAIAGVVAASCAPKLIGLAQAQEREIPLDVVQGRGSSETPDYNDWPEGVVEDVGRQAEQIHGLAGDHIAWLTSDSEVSNARMRVTQYGELTVIADRETGHVWTWDGNGDPIRLLACPIVQ